MQHLEVSGAVRPIYVSLGVKRLTRWHDECRSLEKDKTQNIWWTPSLETLLMGDVIAILITGMWS